MVVSTEVFRVRLPHTGDHWRGYFITHLTGVGACLPSAVASQQRGADGLE